MPTFECGRFIRIVMGLYRYTGDTHSGHSFLVGVELGTSVVPANGCDRYVRFTRTTQPSSLLLARCEKQDAWRPTSLQDPATYDQSCLALCAVVWPLPLGVFDQSFPLNACLSQQVFVRVQWLSRRHLGPDHHREL